MYKVFINDKPVIFTENILTKYQSSRTRIHNYNNSPDLKQVIESFIHNNMYDKLVIINPKNPDLLHDAYKTFFTPVNAAGGIVFQQGKEMLWIFRNGIWDLPKGIVEINENPAQTAIREIEEETGLSELSIIAPIETTYHAFFKKGKYILKVTHWFYMKTKKPELFLRPQENEGITKAEWVDITEIPDKLNNTWANLRDLVQNFIAKYTNDKKR
ncbi:MAG: NUDIX domain-containing protein [Bacteroidales bacterium]|jgi:8-oxo-dGTP pyrophosphatase MutT (NUDIX family)|nr:NUDIX domain-containing protein [Bacteroidales bacterium]